MNNFEKTLCYDDVLLVPQYSDIQSRKNIDISSTMSDVQYSLPIVSAPMDTVTEASMVHAMSECGGLGIIHRYNTIDEQIKLIKRASKFGAKNIAAAIGVTGDYVDRACALYDAGARIICIDVAHGHHIMMRHSLKVLRNTFGTEVHVIAGNVATLKGFNDLSDWGADSVRVGIGGGSICSTRIQTGHGIPTLQSVIECSQSDRSANIIADGGIKNSGDIVKALAAGADFVIIGSLLAGTTQSPGEVFYRGGEKYKTYRGMASAEAQKDWRGVASSLEGISTVIPFKGDVGTILHDLRNGIKSGLSYTGANNLAEFRAKAKFILQSTAGIQESQAHIKSRY